MKHIVLIGVLILTALVMGNAGAGNIYDEKRDGPLYDRAPPDELIRLPKYCWGQYNPKFKSPRYNIDRNICGVRTNHFCQGILRFNRSQNPLASATERRQYLALAIKNFDYTMDGIKPYPKCNIRKHVMLMQKRARAVAGAMP